VKKIKSKTADMSLMSDIFAD